MPGVFPDYPAPVMRNTDHGSELTTTRWGMPPPPKFGGPSVTNIRNTSSPYWRGWLELAFVQVVAVSLDWYSSNSAMIWRIMTWMALDHSLGNSADNGAHVRLVARAFSVL